MILTALALALVPPPAGTPDCPWPGAAETNIPIAGAGSDLSAATWNPQSETLWVARQNRQAWEYGYNANAQAFELVRTLTLPGDGSCGGIGCDIEAIAQIDHGAVEELYTLAEDQGRLSRVVDLGGTPTVAAAWNLEVLDNGHALPPETGNGFGAEALEFAPDADLIAAGFRYPDGSPFTGSTLGMGGLIFIGHQVEGRLHVFDVNPAVSEDFVNHGSFLTASSDIAGLHFDRSSGQMLIWHNTPTNVNSLEVSTLSSDATVGTLDGYLLYSSAMPAGNLEGLALVTTSACGDYGSGTGERALFCTRDGGANNLVLFEGFPCGASTETSRLGTPPNPPALLPGASGGPTLGEVWEPVVDHGSFLTTAFADVLLFSTTSLNFDLGPKGTLLVGVPFLNFAPIVEAGEPFSIPIPFSCSLAGANLYVQAGSDDGFLFELTNALDVVLGTF